MSDEQTSRTGVVKLSSSSLFDDDKSTSATGDEGGKGGRGVQISTRGLKIGNWEEAGPAAQARVGNDPSDQFKYVTMACHTSTGRNRQVFNAFSAVIVGRIAFFYTHSGKC